MLNQSDWGILTVLDDIKIVQFTEMIKEIYNSGEILEDLGRLTL